MSDLCFSSIDELAPRLKKRDLSPVELTRAFHERIHALDDKLHAYIHLMEERALAQAESSAKEIVEGRYRGPLHGIPVAAKDQYDAEGAPSRVRVAAGDGEDATAVHRLREAGAVFFGKLNMSGLPGGLPSAKNPWDLERVPGGSSTGSGAGVAAGLCVGALGEDTAGSIRNPSSFSGVAGLKPTYGRISRYGLAPLSWSLDHCGPMARTVEDLAHMLQATAGFDPKDPTCGRADVPDYSAELRSGVSDLIVGVPRSYIDQVKPAPEVSELFDKALADLESQGARVEEVTVPCMEFATMANGLIYASEFYNVCKADLAKALQNASESRRARMFLGAVTTAADYVQAQRLRSRLKRELGEVFRNVQVIALPTNPAPAPLAAELDGLDTVYKMLGPDLPSPANLAGIPALSLPCGFSASGMPVGFQLWGRPFAESTVLRAGYAYQEVHRWYQKRPAL